MADYQTELSQSGTTLTLKPADGFQRSTVMGEAASDTHQFTGSVYIDGNLQAWTYKVDSVVSGSTIFGNSIADTHQFTGSIYQTGSGATNYFRDSNVFGSGSSSTHQFTGSIYAVSDEFSIVQGAFGGANISGSGNLELGGGITAAGSSIFGNNLADTFQFTGSIFQTGSGGTNYFRDSNVFGYVAPNTFSASITHEITGSTFLTGSVWQYPTVVVTPNAGGAGVHLTSSYVRSVTTSSFHLRSVSGEEIQAGVMQDVVTETSTSWSDGYPGAVTPAEFPTYINITDGYKTAYGVNANTFFRMQNGALSMYGSSRLTNTQVTGNLGGNIVLGGAAYQVDGGGGTSADGITIEPYTCYSVYLTGGMNPINLPHNFKDTSPSTHVVLGRGDGEVSFFGSGSTTAGYLHYLNHHGGWEKTNAAGTGSWGSGSAGNAALLAIAMPVLAGAVYVKTTNPTASIEGMLTRGHFNVVDAFTGSWINGSAVYVHAAVDGYSGGGGAETGAGKLTCTAPTSSNSYVRIVGYCTDTPNVIVFDPDKSWVENS
jgi:hypothetical protein